MVKCEVCEMDDEFLSDENKFHLHHMIPKFMKGTDKDGRVDLCEKHHNILHNRISSVIFNFVKEEDKERCRNTVKKYSEWWIKKEKEKVGNEIKEK